MKYNNCFLFEGLSEAQIKNLLLSLNAKEVKYSGGEEICSYNKAHNVFGVILNGKANVKKMDEDGNFFILENLTKNSVFSDTLSYLATDVNYISVYALETTTVLFLDTSIIFNRQPIASEERLTFINNLLLYTIEKSKILSKRIEILSNKSIKDKILSYFSLLAKNNNSSSFLVPMSYTNLAQYLCVDRSAMMRELKKLNDKGVIISNKRQITIIEK
ncbi:MAG: Crp/Fnr family transcriptional regulator [Clostridia bacterium]|nr:Crp/Fnr family transcriptional regulator [Clostridia bacterium]